MSRDNRQSINLASRDGRRFGRRDAQKRNGLIWEMTRSFHYSATRCAVVRGILRISQLPRRRHYSRRVILVNLYSYGNDGLTAVISACDFGASRGSSTKSTLFGLFTTWALVSRILRAEIDPRYAGGNKNFLA